MTNIKRILLIHLFSNGDCLYATAIARQIKHDYPNCHLTWAIGSLCKSIIDNNPFVDEVWEVKDINKANSQKILRQIKAEAANKKATGEYDEIFFTQIIDDNLANYDGTIRSAIFRGYNKPITVPITPVLRLRDEEIKKVRDFAIKHNLSDYKNVILFEFAPQSGQLAITTQIALNIAEEITKTESTAIILSSLNTINSGKKCIIDGSTLSLRETAALTHYCTLLLGCSSGITWISTSDAAKHLPMIEMLDPNAFWINPVSRDFERTGIGTENLIELYDNNINVVVDCVKDVLEDGFNKAQKKYFKPLPFQFNTTQRSIYNMLVLLQFKSIFKHIKINISVFGWHPLLIKAIFLGFVTMPYKLLRNTINKRFAKK